MKKIINFLPFILILIVFKNWFFNPEIIGGDWPYFFNETLKEFSLFPPAWSSLHGNGLGGTTLTYYLDQYLYFTAFLSTNIFQIPWVVVYKIFWFGLFIALSISSSIYLLKTILPQAKLWQMTLSVLIFTANTYILMVVGGGQMGVALSYAIAPLVIARFIKIIDSLLLNENNKYHPFDKLRTRISNIKYTIIAGMILAVQVMFDPRIAYLSMVAVVFYGVLSVRNFKEKILNTYSLILYTFAIPIGIAVLLHSYWIFPLLVTRTLPVQEGFLSVSGFEFFSFADFFHSFSLLHPNWPENIFGKVYFMRAEFLFLPILAFSSLLFISKIKNQKSKIQIKNKKFYSSSEAQAESRSLSEGSSRQGRIIIYFCLLGLLGTFLAKGANPPFGEINQWLFQYIPGMNMFRDPTKFYLLIALSYSVLIPFGIYSVYRWLSAKCKVQSAKLQFKVKSYIPYLFLLFTILYLIFLVRPGWMGQLGGTFNSYKIPKDYLELKDFIVSQPEFFRTLWVPRQQRFTFVSNIHPAIEAMPLFKATNSSQIVSELQESESQRLLEELSIRYVIIPYDLIGEIFLRNRKYDEKQRIDLEKQLDNIGWLKKIKTGKIAIYETYSHRDHFWLDKGEIYYKMISPTRYLAEISTSTSFGSLIFSENYSPYWTTRIGEEYITSKKTKDGLNSFTFKKAGKYNVEVSYAQEKYFYYGRLVSLSTVIALVIFLIGIRRNFISKN